MGPVPADPDDGRYHPPPTPPLRFGHPINAAALVAVVAAPIMIVVLAIFDGGGLPWFVGTVLTLAFVGGFTTLVLRAKPATERAELPDDGAVL